MLTVNGKTELVVQDAAATRRWSIAWKRSKGFSGDWPMRKQAAQNPRGRCSLGSAASMAYRVEIARNAEADLEELYLWVVSRAPQQGASGSTV